VIIVNLIDEIRAYVWILLKVIIVNLIDEIRAYVWMQ